MDDSHDHLLTLAAKIVSAHVGNNDTPSSALPNLIRDVYNSLRDVEPQDSAPQAVAMRPVSAGPTRGDRVAPSWVQSETVRATTSDGTSVVARVAIDARSAGTRSALEQERQQVSLMLQNSVASHPHQAVLGARGIQRLSSDMRDRLNEFLASRQVEPVRDVIVQDLLVKQR